MSRFQRSWALLKCSFRVIGTNKRLLLFPVVLTLFMVVMAIFFLVPAACWPTGHALADEAHWKAIAQRWFAHSADGKDVVVNPASYALLAGFYLAATFLATFVNVAFYSQDP